MFILTYQYNDDTNVEPIVIGVSSAIAGAKTHAEEAMGFSSIVWSESLVVGEVTGITPNGSVLVIEPVRVLDSKIVSSEN
jgi:hypothetical protein